MSATERSVELVFRGGDQSRKGQATLEYILILAIVAAITVGVASVIRETLDGGILRFGGRLEQNMKTGRTSIDIWTN